MFAQSSMFDENFSDKSDWDLGTNLAIADWIRYLVSMLC